MSTILVTGANGFVGTALCRELIGSGHCVRGVYRAEPQAVEGVEWMHIDDIGIDTPWSELIKDVDVVVHLAARVHVMDDSSNQDALSAYRRVNLEGTRRLADEAVAAGVRRFIYISTAKVNGEDSSQHARHRFLDSDDPEPWDPYALSKWEAEQALRQIAAIGGMELLILRPPLVYGPGVQANFLRLLQIVDRGFPMPLGRIKNCRSLLYLGNFVKAVAVAVAESSTVTGTFLISDDDDVSTPELVRRISQALGRKARLLPVPLMVLKLAGFITGRSAQIDRLAGSLAVDSSRFRKELGWTPPFSMVDGLAATANWYRQQKTSLK